MKCGDATCASPFCCFSYRMPAFRYGGRTILHFDEPLPTSLVRKLLKARIAEGGSR
jgi:hypothetical protein